MTLRGLGALTALLAANDGAPRCVMGALEEWQLPQAPAKIAATMVPSGRTTGAAAGTMIGGSCEWI